MKNNMRQHYERTIEQLTLEVTKASQSADRISWTRPALFLPAVLLLMAGYFGSNPNALAMWMGWALFVAFIIAVTIHDYFLRGVKRLKSKQAFYERLLARMDRDWNKIRVLDETIEITNSFESGVTSDLDIFGQRSLFAWCSLAGTHIGKKTIARWLVELPSIDTVAERQEASKALSDETELREKILWDAAQAEGSFANPDRFVVWAEKDSWIKAHRPAYRASFIGPILIFVGLLVLIVGSSAGSRTAELVGAAVMVVGIAINLLLTIFRMGPIHDIFTCVNTNHNEVAQYLAIFESVSKLPRGGTLLNRVYETCCGEKNDACKAFRSLRRIVSYVNIQSNPRLYLIYFVIQLVLLWDFRVLRILESWQENYRAHVGAWFTALGELEAVMSAATIVGEYPEWCFPEFRDANEQYLHFHRLAHPLLDDQSRVPNDLTMNRSEPVLLITGSNMAGKSTMLRAIGCNMLLSRLGASVCANQFHSRMFVIETSIRVRDSLQDGVSFFMAELKRLRAVVDSTEENLKAGNDVFVLLDEILQGTNSRERQIAVQRVVERLIQMGAITAISTHDLELADVPELQRLSQMVHFREYFESSEDGEVMKFDYQMRPGPTPTTNALKLLDLVGLGEDASTTRLD